MIQSLNTVGQLYVTVFAVSGILCIAAISRARTFDDPDVRRGLVGLLGTTGSWALLKAAYFVLPGPLRAPAYTAGLAIGFGTVWAWLYFCSAYTGRGYHRNRTLRRLGAFIFLAVVSVKFTNPLHGLYFTTSEATVPFAYLAIEHKAIHWTSTGLSYVLSAVGLFVLFQQFVQSGYDTRPLGVLTGLIGLPVVLDIAAQFTPLLIDVIYAPLGVAAFALGTIFVFDRQFIAVQQTASGDDDLSIYLDEHGRIQGCSSSVEEVLPELADSAGEPLSEAVPSVAAAIDADDQLLERERSGETRFYFVSSSNATLGGTGAKVIQLSDVTRTERQRRELVERERELDERNELYRAVIDASFAFVFRVDLDGRFTFVSPSVEEFLEYAPAELEGEPISVTHPDESTTERAWNQIEPVLDGESNRARDFPLETKGGTTVYTDVRAVPIYDGQVPVEERTPGDIVGIQLMVRDATERRQRQGLISVINRVLRHNLRNEMTVINGYAEMLEERLDGDDEEKAAQIIDTSDRLLDLTESARKIEENRGRTPELSATDVVPIVEDTVSGLRTRYPEASVTVDAPETAVAETNDRLETALSELLDNAAKHGGDPPAVDVKVRITDLRVEVVVGDNGPGIPEIERQVLESNTETQLAHGEGLGLWLAYWVVTTIDGELDVAVSSDGTAVTVRLPRPR